MGSAALRLSAGANSFSPVPTTLDLTPQHSPFSQKTNPAFDYSLETRRSVWKGRILRWREGRTAASISQDFLPLSRAPSSTHGLHLAFF